MEAGDQIEEALVAAAAEAQAQEAEAKLNLGFKIGLNLDKNVVEYGLSWSVKHSLSESVFLPDPNQPALPGVDTVTISTPGMDPVTMTGEQFSKAANKLRRGAK